MDETTPTIGQVLARLIDAQAESAALEIAAKQARHPENIEHARELREQGKKMIAEVLDKVIKYIPM